jgi:hypothetical protein
VTTHQHILYLECQFFTGGHPCHGSSTVLAPADFRLFTELKSVLRGNPFFDIEGIKSYMGKDRHSYSGF